jgi:hypothetical protein
MKKYLVFYGFAKLTKKAIKKRSVVIQYANTWNYNDKQKRYIEQKMHIVHQRFQTKDEVTDAPFSNRSWTKWEYFPDDKRWKGNIDLVLENNFVAESNHVSLKERNEIRTKLEKEYYSFYNLPRKQKGQISLIFD